MPDKKLNKREKALLRMLYKYGINKPVIDLIDNSGSSYYEEGKNIPVRQGTVKIDNEYREVAYPSKNVPGKISLTPERGNINKIDGGRKYFTKGEFSDPAFILAHELGHHIQLGPQSEPQDRKRKKLDKYLPKKSTQYDLREINKLTSKSKNNQREADVIGKALLNILDERKDKEAYIKSYENYIKNLSNDKKENSMKYGGRYRKKLRRYKYAKPPEYNLGGFLKKIAPSAVGAATSFIPGVGPALAPLTASATSSLLNNNKEKRVRRRRPTRYASSSYGYRYGGVQPRKEGGVKSNRVKSKVKSKTTSEKKEYNRKIDKNLRERIKRMRQGDYSMVGETVNPDAKKKKWGGKYQGGGKMKYAYGGGYVEPKNFREANENFRSLGGYKHGGVTPMGRDAVKYNGPKHEQGGIPIDERGNPTNENNASAEVEGGETRDGDYIFSDTLTVPGTQLSFAEAHERLMKEGANEEEIAELRMMQEQVQEQEGVQGGDEQVQPQSEGQARSNEAGTLSRRAQKVTNQDATGKGAGEPVGYGRGRMKHGGRHYQFGGIYDRRAQQKLGTQDPGYQPITKPEVELEGMRAKETPYSSAFAASQAPTGGESGFGLEDAADIAGYAVPSLMRAGMALTDKGVEDTPRMKPRTVPVQSRAFRGAERDIESGYRAILADPNASTTEKLAAQSQLIQGRSDLAGQEADYRSRQERFNVGQETQAQAQNIRSFQQDREIKAREDAARKKLLTEAVEMPITQYRADQAGEKQQIANILTSANQIQDPVNRRNTIARNLRALGLSDEKIQNIIRRYEA